MEAPVSYPWRIAWRIAIACVFAREPVREPPRCSFEKARGGEGLDRAGPNRACNENVASASGTHPRIECLAIQVSWSSDDLGHLATLVI